MACEIEKAALDNAIIADNNASAELAAAQQTKMVTEATRMIAQMQYDLCRSRTGQQAAKRASKKSPLESWIEWRDKLIECGLEYAKEMEAMNKMKPK